MPLQHSEDCSSSDIPCNDSCQLLGYVLKAARFARYTRFWIRGRCWYNTSGLPGKGPENRLHLPALSTSLLHAPRCLSSFAQECPRMCRKNGHRGVVCDTKDSLCVHQLPTARAFGYRWWSRVPDASSNRWMVSSIMIKSAAEVTKWQRHRNRPQPMWNLSGFQTLYRVVLAKAGAGRGGETKHGEQYSPDTPEARSNELVWFRSGGHWIEQRCGICIHPLDPADKRVANAVSREC